MTKKERYRVVEGKEDIRKHEQNKGSHGYEGFIPNAYWWQCALDGEERISQGEEVHARVSDHVRDLFSRQRNLWERDKRHVYSYMGQPMKGLGPESFTIRAEEPPEHAYNLCQSSVDTLMSHFSSKKSKPQFLTNMGDPGLQKRARQMQQAIDGLFYEIGYYAKPRQEGMMSTLGSLHMQSIFDASVCDFGGIHHYERKGPHGLRPAIERLVPWESLDDQAQCFYGLMPEYGTHRSIAADQLACLDYPGSIWQGVTDHLGQAYVLRDDDPKGQDKAKGKFVSVVEIFRPDTEYGSGDGRHAIVIPGWTAVYEKWDEPLPYTFIRWSPQIPVGWRGQGVVERLYDANEKLKLFIVRINKAAESDSIKICVQKGSKLVKNQLTNEDYTVLTYVGVKPEVLELGMIPQGWVEWVNQIIKWSRDVIGLNEMSISAEKPKGIIANEALETMIDLQSRRLANPEIASDDFVIDNTVQLIRRCRRIAKQERNFAVMLKDSTGIKPMLWRDIDIDDSDYRLQIFPSNYLPMTGASRVQKVIDLSDKIPELRPFFLGLLDFPDIQSATKMLSAPTTWIMQTLQKILEEGTSDDVAVEPSWDLDLATNLADKFIAMCEIESVDRERIELIRRFRDSCIEERKRQIQQQASVNAMGTPQGPGMPMPLAAPQGAPQPQGVPQ